MCVLIHQPIGEANFTKALAKKAFNQNPDGAGYAYISPVDGLIKVKKTMSFNKFWQSYRNDYTKFGENADFLIHFRIATSGKVNLNNVHPFTVDSHTVMAHNGVISDMPTDVDKSDTALFVEKVLHGLPRDWLDNRYLVRMVEEYIGWSRLGFLTTDPLLEENAYILNKSSGVDYKNMWFSNGTGLGILPPPAPRITRASDTARKYGSAYYDSMDWDDGAYSSNIYRGQGLWQPASSHRHYESSAESVASALAEIDAQKSTIELNNTLKEGAEYKETRKEWGLDPNSLVFEADSTVCMICETPADADGICSCWDFFCRDCSNLLPNCKHADYPSNLVLLDPYPDKQEEELLLKILWQGTTKSAFLDLTSDVQDTLLPIVVQKLTDADELSKADFYFELATERNVIVPF